MNPDEYAWQQAKISAAISLYVANMVRQFLTPSMGVFDWANFIHFLFPEVKRRRDESAALARQFYDKQREIHGLPNQAVDLPAYEERWLAQRLEPWREQLQEPETHPNVGAQITRAVVREVENGGRRTIIRAVEDDAENDPVPERASASAVKGWARVATGRETCAWCLMLVSRGAVYLSASSAGLDVDDQSAVDLFDTGSQEELDDLMEKWHDGCDCKVVPVFDTRAWPGRDAWKRAEQHWKDHAKGSGHERFLSFRRAVDNGLIDTDDFAGLAA